MRRDWIAIVGPTGSGKSALGLDVARAAGGEIVSCDSVQLYRGLDVGSAKPTAAERAEVPHHLIDCLDPADDCDAARYATMARAAIEDVRSRGRLPVLVGGTGLYLRALLTEAFDEALPKDEALRASLAREATTTLHARLAALDPTRAAELHPNDRVRVVRALELNLLVGRPTREIYGRGPRAPSELRGRCLLVILDPPRPLLHERIEARTRAMLAGGLVDEVRGLLAAGVDPGAKPMQSIGYKQVVAHLAGALDAAELPGAIDAATRQYAKRQVTWFKKVKGDLRLAAWSAADVLGAGEF